MGSVVANLGAGIAGQLGSYVNLPKITVPNTNIVNRAQCVDPSNDLLPRFGVNRVAIQQFEEVQGESGPNGERVFKPINDSLDQVRMYGNWASENVNHGPNVNVSSAPPTTDSMEIVFYGTGLNLLIEVDNAGAGRSIKVAVDGGSLGSELFPSTGSSVLAARSCSVNNVINVLSGLTLGVHTARIQNGSTRIYGYEVLNTNSTLQYTAGSAYYGSNIYTNALTTDGYNSNFTSGTLGTTGGHALVYITQGGSIRKAVTPTAASPSYLSSASHTNESVIRTYHYREFAAGRSDDFTTNGGTQTRSFTLDDGTTTLSGASVDIPANVGLDALRLGTLNGFITFTFVGTGLDIVRIDDVGTTTVDTLPVLIDGGVSVGNLSSTATPNIYRVDKIVSGLPYGTHTFQVSLSVAGGNGRTSIRQFIVYGPSTPALPSGAIALADYYIMANYVNSGGLGQGSDNYKMSTGTLYKNSIREHTYLGTSWSGPTLQVAVGSAPASGWYVSTSNVGDSWSYTFIGTGIELWGTYGASSVQTISLTGGGLSGNYTGSATSNGGSWNPVNSQWTMVGANGSRLIIQGLTFAVYTIKSTLFSGNVYNFGVAVITPVHSPKLNTPGSIQNTLSIGSQGLGDQRTFSTQAVKTLASWAQATGVAAGTYTVVSGTPFPVPDLTCVIKTSGNPIDASFDISYEFDNTTTADMGFAFYVDGVSTGTTYYQDVSATNAYQKASARRLIPVSAGVHIVQVVFLISGTTSHVTLLQGTSRSLYVHEI